MAIRFGTSGWRAIIADDFTFDNVRRVSDAISSYLTTRTDLERTLVVGHDSRFMGERFSEIAADIFAAKGFRVLLCGGPTPTPTIAHAIRSQKAAGGINFTASHNPPEYQGIKFSTEDGAPALPEVTGTIEAGIEAITLSPMLGDFNDDLTARGLDALAAQIRVQIAPEDVSRFMAPTA